MQSLGGATEVQFLSDGQKGAQLVDIHPRPRFLVSSNYYRNSNTQRLIRYWTDSNLLRDSELMYTGNPDVPDDVFSDVLKQISVFVRTKVMPRELEIMATDSIPADLRAQAAEMGLFGYAIPQEWGGLGLDLVQDAEVAMELGYTSLALRSMFGTNNGIAGQVLVGFGTDEQKAHGYPTSRPATWWRLRADRTRCRVQPRGPQDHREAGWRRLDHQRQQAVHHQRH